MAGRIIKVAGLVILAAALSAPFASAAGYLNTPALDQGMQGSVSTTATSVTPQSGGPWAHLPSEDRPTTNLNTPINGSTLRPGSGWVPGGSYSGVNPDNYRNATTGGGNTGAPVSSTGNDFNWGSAGFGAAGFAALALAIALLAGLARRGRHTDIAVS